MAFLELAAAMTIVGSSVVVGKLIVASMPVFLVGGLRFALAALVLVPLLLFTERPWRVPNARDLGTLALQAFAGIFAFNVLLLYGLSFTTAAESGVVTGTTPAVAGLLSCLLLGERLTVRRLGGIGLAVLGILAITVAGGAEAAGRGDRPLLGNVLVFGAVVGEGLFIVCGKVASRRMTPLTVATGITLMGLVMFLPFALWEARAFDLGGLGAAEWLAIGYYGVAVTVIAFLLWARGVAQVPASTAAGFTSLLPVSAVGLSYLVLGEPFAWSHAIGAAFVIGGIALLAREQMGDSGSRRRA